jgi:hypothetical protein
MWPSGINMIDCNYYIRLCKIMFLDLSILSCVNSIIGTRWLNMAELVPTLNSKDALNESVCLSPTGGQQLRLFLCI